MADKIDQIIIPDSNGSNVAYDIDLPPDATPSISSLYAGQIETPNLYASYVNAEYGINAGSITTPFIYGSGSVGSISLELIADYYIGLLVSSGAVYVGGHLQPDDDMAFDLGESQCYWNNAYLQDIYTNMIYAKSSTIGLEAVDINIEPTAGYLTIDGLTRAYGSVYCQDILPRANNTYNLGNTTSVFKSIYASDVYVNGLAYATDIYTNSANSQIMRIKAVGASNQNTRLYLYASGGTTTYTAGIVVQGGSSTSSNGVYLQGSTYARNLYPQTTNTYDLGSSNKQWDRIYGSNIYVGNNVYTARVVSAYSLLISGYSGVSLSANSDVNIYTSSGNIICVLGSNNTGLMIENYSKSYVTHPVLAGYVHTITLFREMSGNVSQTYYDLKFSMLLTDSASLTTYSDIMYALNNDYNIPWGPEENYLHLYDYLPINGVVKHYYNNTVYVYHATGLYLQSGNLCYIANNQSANFTVYPVGGILDQSAVTVMDHVKMLQ